MSDNTPSPKPTEKTAVNNPVKTLGDDVSQLAHEAASGAERSFRSTQRAAQEGMDRMADELDDARVHSNSALHRLTREAESLSHRSMDAVREGSHQLRERSTHARDATTSYIQHEPVKSMLMAAAVGAALMGLVALFSRHSGPGR
jgi:ElaB/YqjD/DUF883 family membrane-anchored ribosome-binding protein